MIVRTECMHCRTTKLMTIYNKIDVSERRASHGLCEPCASTWISQFKKRRHSK